MSKIDDLITQVNKRETCDRTRKRIVKTIERIKRRAIANDVPNWEHMSFADLQRELNCQDKKRTIL